MLVVPDIRNGRGPPASADWHVDGLTPRSTGMKIIRRPWRCLSNCLEYPSLTIFLASREPCPSFVLSRLKQVLIP